MKKGLECRQIGFYYPTKGNYKPPVLNAISHSFKAGQQTLICGPTGSGKSTLLHLLAGLMRPTEGQILANDKPVSRWISRHLDLWRRKVGLVFQEPHLFSDLTIVENLAVPLVPLGIKRKEANRLIMDFLSRLDLTHLAAQPAGSLSGGERQRLTIARALIVHPMFLLADEPTSFQDDDHTTHILNLFIQEQNRGASVVVCSHDDRMISCGDFDVILKLNQGHLEPA